MMLFDEDIARSACGGRSVFGEQGPTKMGRASLRSVIGRPLAIRCLLCGIDACRSSRQGMGGQKGGAPFIPAYLG